jgi:acid stress chaperone HdeB
MTMLTIVLPALALALLSAPAAQAQVTIDISKITCEQLLLWKVTDPEKIAYWLSGYYNGKRDNTLLDTSTFEQNVNKVKDYCRSNYNTTVMQAVDAVLPRR